MAESRSDDKSSPGNSSQVPAASPLSTGGAGPAFETDVAVYYLASLLTGGIPRGATPGQVVSVAVQRAAIDSPLDDVVVETKVGAKLVRLELQAKRTLTFRKSDTEFSAVLKMCWSTFHAPGFSPESRFGVAVGHYPEKLRSQYSRVSEYAVSSGSAEEFVKRIGTPGLASDDMRRFVTIVRDALVEIALSDGGVTIVTEDSLWRFFRSFVSIDFDFTQNASRDRSNLLESLRQVVLQRDLPSAQQLYDRLSEVARQSAQSAGKHTAESLRLLLGRLGVDLNPALDFTSDLDRLAEHTDQVLDSIQTTIGGFTLDRSEVMASVFEAAREGEVLLLTGSPGVGKSAILRSLAETRRPEGVVIALAGELLANVGGWNGLSSLLGLTHRLDQLIINLSASGRATLVIDGLDRIDEDGGRRAVNAILSAVAEFGGSRWTVVLTSRTETLDVVQSWLKVPSAVGWTRTKARVFPVPDLTDHEVEVLAGLIPPIARLLSSARVDPVVRTPYFLHIIEQSLHERRADPSPLESRDATPTAPVSEADVLTLWWERVVGRDGNRPRQQAMLEFGNQVLTQRTHRMLGASIDGNVLRSLETDGILRRDPTSDTFFFGHDILEEWSAARTLAQHANPISYLDSLGNPYWAGGALQLLACWRLEAKGAEAWSLLLLQSERQPSDEVSSEERKEGDSSSRVVTERPNLAGRWTDSIITAPFRSARLTELMPSIADELLAKDAARLVSFLRALRTRFIRPNPTLKAVVEQVADSPEERDALLLEMGWPWAPVWMPVLDWLVPRLPNLPWQARDEASRVMLIWQRVAIPNLPHAREIGEAALMWRSVLLHPSGRHVHIDRDAQPFYDRLRDIIVFSANAIPDRIPGFLSDLRRTESSHTLERWVGQTPQPALAAYAPDAYVDFTLDVLVPKWRDTNGDQQDGGATGRRKPFSDREEDDEWERLHSYLSSAFIGASQVRGPFLLLLESSEDEGLRLVNTLVNRATKAYGRDLALHEHSLLPITLNIASDQPREPGIASTVGVDPSIDNQIDETSEVEVGASRVQKFLGDARVYQWFRPNSSSPYPVRSALMALEVWMEQQVEKGRDPSELLHKVLAGSESAAVVGTCVGIALAYPEKFLVAAEPFLGSPAIWMYDIQRWVSDKTPTFDASPYIGFDEPGDKIARSRDNRPQRRVEIRSLVWRYVFSPDEAQRDRVVAAIKLLPDDLSLLTEEEQGNPAAVKAWQRQAEEYVAFADIENYEWVQFEDGSTGLQFTPPSELVKRNAPAEKRRQEMFALLSVHNWASETLRTGVVQPRITLAEAVVQAAALEKPDDYTTAMAFDGDPLDLMRLETIVTVAAAVLLVDPKWAEEAGHLAWCQEVLVRAASLPVGKEGAWVTHGGATLLIPATKGLLALVKLGRANEAVRLALGKCSRYPERNVSATLFPGLRSVWDIDPVLVKSLVSRELALAVVPKEEWALDETERSRRRQLRLERIRDIDSTFEQRIRESQPPTALELRERNSGDSADGLRAEFWTSHVTDALLAVPRSRVIDGTESEWVGQVLQFAFTWTIAQYPTDKSGHSSRPSFPYEWPDFLGEQLAILAQAPGTQSMLDGMLASLRQTWPATAGFAASLLYGYSVQALVSDVIPQVILDQWHSMSRWIIGDEPIDPFHAKWMSEDRRDAFALLVHVRHGRALLTANWSKAPQLSDVYEAWMKAIGHTAWGLRTFIIFLAAGGRHLDASFIIRCLSGSVEQIAATEDPDSIWKERSVGMETAQYLAGLWENSRKTIENDPTTLVQFVSLLEELRRAGVPLAAQLREKV